jgi:glycosyltransferase involved in cell wall biosynthesis
MRVLHRINLNVAGGVENQFVQFLGHPRVGTVLGSEVLLGDPAHPSLTANLNRHAEAVHTFKRWRGVKLPRRPAAIRRWNTARIVGERRPDALLSWSTFAKPELTAACHRHGVPLIYREGGAAWGEAAATHARAFLDLLAGAVCNTRASERILRLKWDYRGASRICLGGIRPDVLDAAAAPRRLGDRVLVLGSAARLVGVKGVALTLHALAALGRRGVNAELRVAGDGPDRASLARLARSLGIADRVRFLGHRRDMRTFYRDIDVLVHPALREPLGNVCIEAAANGCVVVAARVDGLAETVLDGVTGVSLPAELALSRYRELGGNVAALPAQVYDPDRDCLRGLRCVDPERLASAVANLVSDPERFSAMSAAALTEIRERFSFDRYVEDMIRAIREFTAVVSTSGAPGVR